MPKARLLPRARFTARPYARAGALASPPARRVPGRRLLDLHAADRARDHEALDLRGALEDGVDLGVAVPALDGVLARVADAPEDLYRALGRPHRDLAGLELGHRALGVGELVALLAHPRRAPDEQPRGIDLHLHVGEREGDGLVLDDRLAELHALLRILERVLVGRAGDADRLRADGRPAGLEGLHRRLALGPRALAGARQALVELLLAAQQTAARDAALVEEDVGGVRRAQAVLLDLRAHLQALGAGRDDERGLPARAELAVDRGDDDVHVGDAAVGRPRLLAVEDPFVLGLVVLGERAQRRDVRAGVGLAHAERGDLRLVLGPEALRDPLHRLVGRARAEDAGDGERGTHDRHADPGVAPEELLVDDRQGEAGRVAPELRDRLEAVEADLGGLLDDRPGRLLALVPLRGGGADGVLAEAVDPLADVELVLVEGEGEGGGLGFGRGHEPECNRCSHW